MTVPLECQKFQCKWENNDSNHNNHYERDVLFFSALINLDFVEEVSN